MTSAPPLLDIEQAFIGTREQLALRDFSLTSEARHLLLVQPAMSLFRLFAGRGPERLLEGRVALVGRDVSCGDHHAVTGILPSETPLPPRWRLQEYLAWAARVSPASKKASRERVAATIEQLGMAGIRKQQLRHLGGIERMALRFAAAIIHQPEVLVLELPAKGWGGGEAAMIRDWLTRCCRETRLLLCTPSLPAPDSPWFDVVAELCVVQEGVLLAQAPPARRWPNPRCAPSQSPAADKPWRRDSAKKALRCAVVLNTSPRCSREVIRRSTCFAPPLNRRPPSCSSSRCSGPPRSEPHRAISAGA
jgi:energy-coupling factor transporter ATP-binding protein EcfA2